MLKDKFILKLFAVVFGVLFMVGLLSAMIAGGQKNSGGNIAVVEVKGPIVGGESGSSLLGESVVGSDTMMRQIRAAAKDRDVKALLLHINSPGGSAPASEEVYTEILRFKEVTGKPVLAVMGDVAASGGYFIAAAADEIYANPATMTGSIGVIMQFKNYTDFYQQYGVRIETFKSGKYKDIGNPAREMRPDERELLQSMVDQIYERFVAAVVKGRQLPRERVLELAQGQIYTGTMAQEVKLVDHLGNFYDAVEYLAKKHKIKEPVLKYYRSSPSLLGQLFGGSARRTSTGVGQMSKAGEFPFELMLIEESLRPRKMQMNY